MNDRNRDWSTNPPTPMDETPRTYKVRCDGDCLAYEFWTEEFLGLKSGEFEVTLSPRSARSIALRRPQAYPQLIGSNRHPTQGATDFQDLVWDEKQRTLSGHLLGSVGTVKSPFEHRLAVRAPAGYLAVRAEVDGVAQPVLEQKGELVRVRFTLPAQAQGKSVGIKLVF